MGYLIKHQNKPVLRFELIENTADPIVKITWVTSEKNREQVRRLLTYDLKKNPRYNVPDDRFRLIAKTVKRRARMLLE